MSQENSFINESLSKRAVHEMPRDTTGYLDQELQEDISVFSEEERGLISRHLDTEKLNFFNSKELEILYAAIGRWWKEKYGFSFTNKIARDEVLVRKYSPTKEFEKRKNLQAKLLGAVARGDEQEINRVKKECIETYPDQLEEIEVIFGIQDFIKKQREFDTERINWSHEKKLERFRDFTEYQFLFTHFILLNNKNKEFMELFWKAGLAVAERMGAVQEFNQLQRSQVSQVAVYKIVESLGKNPKLSHPDEDAFNAIDLWAEGDQAIQIKGWEEETPAIIESDTVAFPAIQSDGTKRHKFFNSMEFFKSKNTMFRAKIKKYGEKIGRDISGHMLVVPYSKIDFTTGEPAPELVEFFRNEIK